MVDMVNDYFEYFLKEIENEDYIEIYEIVRQKIWREAVNEILSRQWIGIDDRIRRNYYWYLLYN